MRVPALSRRHSFGGVSCELAVALAAARLEFLASTDVGRWIPVAAEYDAQSEASEWELKERDEIMRRLRSGGRR
jgi:hypothetical protein